MTGCQYIAADPRTAATPGADDLKCGEPVAFAGCAWCAGHLRRVYTDDGEALRRMRRDATLAVRTERRAGSRARAAR